MYDTSAPSNLEFKHLLFRPSNKGGGIFTAKIKTYKDKKKVGEEIVIANPGSGITKKGRWNVKCRKTAKGTGYVVLDAKWSIDEFTLSIRPETFVVQVMVNGREDRLMQPGGVLLPLAFSCRKYQDPEVVAGYIRRKVAYLQPNKSFNVEEFCSKFTTACAEIYELFEQRMKETDGTMKVAIDMTALTDRYGR